MELFLSEFISVNIMKKLLDAGTKIIKRGKFRDVWRENDK